jgi:hypothetical protein
VQLLKQRPIRLLEDHAEADHADAQLVAAHVDGLVHGDIITAGSSGEKPP